MLTTVDSLDPVSLPQFRDERGTLVPLEMPRSLPFPAARFFWIYDVRPGTVRGAHAHKRCQQFMICATGSLRVDAYDGATDRSIELSAGQALYVPPAIFTTEWFRQEGTTLMVFCDRAYEGDDYLTTRDALVQFRHEATSNSLDGNLSYDGKPAANTPTE